MKKQHSIVMLPTEKASILKMYPGNDLSYNKGWGKSINGIHQELYVLSDEEIKEECYILLNNKRIAKVFRKDGTLGYLSGDKTAFLFIQDKKYSKIIATTDLELCNTYMSCPSGKYWEDEPVLMTKILGKPTVAGISPDFLQVYVKAYNEKTPIMDIMVEYELDKEKQLEKDAVSSRNRESFGPATEFKLKLRPDNSIIISKVKEQTFTREDMEKAFIEGGVYCNDRIGRAWHKLGAKEWLDKNYPNK